MITVQMWRDDRPLMGSGERSVFEALKLLTICELGFGGRVEVFEPPTRLRVRTWLLGGRRYDDTEFSGSEEEMRALVVAAAIHAEIVDDYRGVLASVAMQKLGNLAEIPLVLASMAPILMNEAPAKLALLAGAGFTDPAEIAAIADRRLDKDKLEMVAQTRLETGRPVLEILAEVA